MFAVSSAIVLADAATPSCASTVATTTANIVLLVCGLNQREASTPARVPGAAAAGGAAAGAAAAADAPLLLPRAAGRLVSVPGRAISGVLAHLKVRVARASGG